MYEVDLSVRLRHGVARPSLCVRGSLVAEPIVITGSRAVVKNKERGGIFGIRRDAEERRCYCDADREGEGHFLRGVDASPVLSKGSPLISWRAFSPTEPATSAEW